MTTLADSALTLIWVLLGLTGDCFFKKGAKHFTFVFLGALLYLCCSIPATIAYRRSSFITVCYRWDCYSLLATPILGLLAFGEHLTFRKVVVLAFLLAAMLLNDAPAV